MVIEKTDGKTKVDLLNKLCVHFYNSKNTESINYGKQAIKLAKEISYKAGLQVALYNIGRTYINALDYESALTSLQESLNYTDTSINPKAIMNIYNNIGIVYYLIEDKNKALEYYRLGRNILQSYPDSVLTVRFDFNIAIILAERAMYDSALYYFKKAYKLASLPNVQIENMESYILVNMAEVYDYTGEYELARQSADLAIKVMEPSTDLYVQSGLYLALGSANRSIKQYADAEIALKKSIKLAEDVGALRRELEAYRFLIQVYKNWGKYQLALEAFEQYELLYDSTLTIEKNKEILDIEARYNSEKKEKEIELLKKEAALTEANLARYKMRNYLLACFIILAFIVFALLYKAYRFKLKSNEKLSKINRSLQKSESQLLELNSMKDNLIRIIGHDLKNPISSIVGFAELLTTKDSNNKPEKVTKYAEIIYQTTNSITQLLDNILYWARLQQGNYKLAPSDFNVFEAINQGVDPFKGIAENKKISIEIETNEKETAFGDSFTCSIIIGNLFNNALKFSHPNSKVRICAEKQIDKVKFSVIDYGVGMDENTYKSIFNNQEFKSTMGTNEEKGTGFGLKICKQFVELNGGKLEVESEKDKGTCFSFSFPVIENKN